MKTAYMLLANGFEESEAIFPLDLLRRAGVDIKTVAIDCEDKLVTGSHGISVIADLSEDEVCLCDTELLILPGGMPGTLNLQNSEAVRKAVVGAYENGAFVCAICAAPRILGLAGLLKGKKAVCYPSNEVYLEGADVLCDVKCVRDGRIITAKSASCAMEFGLAIVEAVVSAQAKDELERAIIV